MRQLFRWLIQLRKKFSKVVEPLYPESDYEPSIPRTLPELGQFMRDHYTWSRYPVYDHLKSIKAMNYDLEHESRVFGDCGGLATYTAWMLLRMSYPEVYRVNIPELKHVVCVFSYSIDDYRVADSRDLWSAKYFSLDEAIQSWAIVRRNRHLQPEQYSIELLSMDDFSQVAIKC